MRRFFSRPLVRGLLALIALLATVYVLAPLFEVRDRLAAVKLVGLLAVSLWAIYAIYVHVADWRLAWKLRAQARTQAAQVPTDARADLAQLEEGFKKAFDELARLRPEARPFRAGGPDSLPWIVLLGPPGAGKSTALQNAGLRFTQLGRKLQGIGGTRHCAWWLAEEAIFLDTAGRYAVQEEDHDEWLGFLELLRRHRRERPIDAVVLQVGLDEIEVLSPTEIEEMALELQHRLDELMVQLGVRFPVHLVFSKADLLDGFTEFFEGLPRDTRDQAWGFQLDVDRLGTEGLGARFAERFDALVASLTQRVTPRLGELTSREARLSALAFPGELARRRERLQLFTEVLFESGAHRERPWLTSISFISATREGDALPGQRETIARQMSTAGLPRQALPTSSGPFFVRGLFEGVIQQARNAARPSRQALQKLRSRRRAALALLFLLCLGSSWLLTWRYLGTRRWLERLGARSEALVGSPLPRGPATLTQAEVLKELELQAALDTTLSERMPFGFVEDAHRLASDLLRDRIDRVWVLPLKDVVNARLQAVSSWHPGDPGELLADGFLALKAVTALRHQECAGTYPDDTRKWLTEYLLDAWQVTLGARAGELLGDSARDAVRNRLLFALEGDRPSSLALDESFQAQARSVLGGDIPPVEVLFGLILRSGGLSAQEPQLEGELLVDRGLARAYTPWGCEQFKAAIAQDREWWSCLLGAAPPADDALVTAYQERYLEAHQAWLEGLSLRKPIRDLASAQEAVEQLVQGGGGLTRILRVMAGTPEATHDSEVTKTASPPAPGGRVSRLWASVGRAAGGTQKVLAEVRATDDMCIDASRPLGTWAMALRPDNAVGKALANYQTSLQGEEARTGLRARLRSIALSADTSADALALVRESMGAKGELAALVPAREDLVAQLKAATPPADPTHLGDILEDLESQTAEVLMPLAAQGVQDLYTTGVMNGWVDLKRARGPKDPAEVCKDRLDYLTGVLEPFVTEQLSPFYEGNNYRTCQLKRVFGQTIPLSTGACRAVNAALKAAHEATCPAPAEPGGPPPKPAPPPPPRLPRMMDTSRPQCDNNIEKAELDNGEQLVQCSMSYGCLPPKKSPGGGPQLRVKRQRDRDLLVLAAADTYPELVARGRRHGNDVLFPLDAADCPDLAVVFTIPEPTSPPPQKREGDAPSPSAKGDNRWRTIDLPSSLLEGRR